MELSLQTARRLAVRKQFLAGDAPPPTAAGIIDLVRRLGCLQFDPIPVVQRPQLLIPWSRLGTYDVAEMDRLLWDDRSLFHYWAHAASLVLTEDYPIHQVFMRRYPSGSSVRVARLLAWLDENSKLKRHILLQLRRNGPTRTKDFKDLAVTAYASDGWNNERNVDRMLDYLWTKGRVMIAGRLGQERIWDLAERWFPEWMPKKSISVREGTRRSVDRAVRALGIATVPQVKLYFTRWRHYDLPAVLDEFLRARKLVEARVVDDGSALPGKWYLHADDMALVEDLEKGEWDGGRTTLLSPFDNLICDRKRTKMLFDFDYTIEIYVPAATRKYGYYVLPILHGDRLIGRLDALMDRKNDRLEIKGLWAERSASSDAGSAVRGAVDELAKFLGATELALATRVPKGWKAALT